MVFRHSIANTSTTSFARQIRNGAPAFWREDNDAPFSCFLLCKPEQHTKSYDYLRVRDDDVDDHGRRRVESTTNNNIIITIDPTPIRDGNQPNLLFI
jgi:hypothetical protein